MSNILLLDDDAFALKTLSQQLRRLGVSAITLCGNGSEAVALLEERPEDFPLVICDLQMPEMDGVEFVRHLARIGYGGNLALVSGESGRVLRTVNKLAKAHRIRVLGGLNKPVSSEQLRQLLASHAAGRTAAGRRAAASYPPEELARAIANGELVNHYQPKVELASGALVGVEALVRWQHPRDGLVFPGQFIDSAEASGLIDALTQSVFGSALRQSRQWADAGLALQMAVNVSMDNLMTLDFPETLERMAEQTGVALSSLSLEVTESRLMQDARLALDVLTRLHLKRVVLSIDDFGTGHSSLAQLRDVPFGELKLDRSFVTDAGADPALAAIVESTLGMASRLGLKTVAEGIEVQSDWEFMRRLGCDVAQGYFIARPMPADALADWRCQWELQRRGVAVAQA